MGKSIPIQIKKKCCEMLEEGASLRAIYDEFFRKQFESPQNYASFTSSMRRWRKMPFPDDTTLRSGTYEGFIAHDATVQVSGNGEIVQAWIKQKPGSIDPEDFVKAIRETVKPYEYTPNLFENSFHMLEIPLFDMHWGIAFMDYYEPVLHEILDYIHSHPWDRIVIPFGQDFFHNDSIANGCTTKGTPIEKVDMMRAVKEGRQFVCTIIDAAIECANKVKVLYTPGNHDRSISWMFIQVLLERYGASIVDDSLEYRKIITYGKNSIMVTHGDSKQATPNTLAQIFPISFAKEFADANIREVHAGHLHHEAEADIHGVMVRRLSSGSKTDEWSDREDFVGVHKRFMLFDWSLDKLTSIHYV